MPQLKVQNFYSTALTSDIVGTGDTSFTVTVAPTFTSGFLVISPNNASLREIVYFHNVVGNTVSVRAENRWQGGTTARSHTSQEPVAMKDIAEIFNMFSDMISQMFYVEKLGWLQVKVWGGYVYYNGNMVTVPDTTLTLTNNVTNYIKYSYATNTLSVDTSSSGNVKVVVVTLSNAITSISYRNPKESYIDFAVTLNTALPSQPGNTGKVLFTDGTNAYWGNIVIPNALTSAAGLTRLAQSTHIDTETDSISSDPLVVQPSMLSRITAHQLPCVIDMTAPMAIDSFDTQLISSNAAVDTPDRLTETFVSGGSSIDLAMTYVFIPSKNLFLNSATYDGTRNTGYTVTLKETVSLAVLYTGAWNATATDTFGTGVFLRKWISYTVDTRWTWASTYTYTFPSGDLTLSSLTTVSRNPSSLTFNYAIANNIPFGITTVSHVTTPVSAVWSSISQIQIALRKVGTPPQVVNVELLNSAGTVIAWASATIASGTVTTSQANYNVTLGTPYTASVAEKLFVKVSTTGSDNANYYMIYGSTVLVTTGINSYTNADANPLFFASITSSALTQYIWVPCHPTRSKVAGLIKKNYTAGSLMNLFVFGYLPYTGLTADTTYYVNTDNSGGITTNTSSAMIIWRTYAKNFIAKIF